MSTIWQDVARLLTASATVEDDRPAWATPGALATDLDPLRTVGGRTIGTIQTPALDLIDQALVELADTPDGRLIISMPPQEGKSQRASRRFPLWALTRNPDLRVAIASYEHNVARRWGRAIRDDVLQHGDVVRLGVRADVSAQNEWQVATCAACWDGEGNPPEGKHREGHDGGVYTTGVGGALTGRPVDLLIIDDPVKDRLQAESRLYRDRVWDWWTDVASTRLAPGAPVVLILTRWHHDDLAGRLLAAEDGHLWKVINIPAECVDPDTDPLDRELGEFMVSARGRTMQQWAAIKVRSGARTWGALYQGRPTPDTGNLFPADGWARYTQPPWVTRDDGTRWVPNLGQSGDEELIQSWDFTFKDTDSSDYVVGQVWLRRGVHAYLLDQVRRRAAFSESVQMMLDLTARWPQAVAKLVEDKANGPAILNAIRGRVGGLIPVEPEGSKYARASAVTPFVEARNVWLPDPTAVEGTAWVTTLTEEARDFPQAKNDDTVDALSQAVHRLLLVPILDDTIHDADDLLDDPEDLALHWAPTAY